MKTLILMRHGKSDWSRDTPDIERSINERGRMAASLMASWLSDQGLRPDRLLVSPATRTQQTAERLLAVWGEVSRVTVEALYLAEPEEILDAVQREGGGETVLLLGHNPGLEIGATWLAVDLPPLDMPTCAIAVLRFPVAQWQDVTEGQGALLHHVTPKSLV